MTTSSPLCPTCPRTSSRAAARWARACAAIDWSATPGPVEPGRRASRPSVRIMLTSRYAMWMAWGRSCTFFYNDAYRPTLGRQAPLGAGRTAPTASGRDLGRHRAAHRARAGDGDATWDEGLLLFLRAHGYPEETYHTFSYSPVPRRRRRTCAACSASSPRRPSGSIGERRLGAAARAGGRLPAARQTSSPAGRPSCADRSTADRATCRSRRSTWSTSATWPAPPARGRQLRPAPAARSTSRPATLAGPLGACCTGAGRAHLDARRRATCAPVAGPGRSRVAQAMLAAAAGAAGQSARRRAAARHQHPAARSTTATAASFAWSRRRSRAARRTRPRLRGGAAARRGAGRARPRQDRVLPQRQPRVPHAADADARADRGPARRRPRLRPRDARARWRPCHRNALRLLKLVNTLLDFSRIEAGRAQARYRADRPGRAHRRARQRLPLRDRARRPAPRRRLPAARRAGLRRPRHVGEDRPQPALERVQVHASRARSRSRCAPARPARLELTRARHRHRHPGRASCRACSSASTASRARARARTRAPASAWRWCRSWCGCTAARSSVESEPGRGTALHGRRSRSASAHLPAERDRRDRGPPRRAPRSADAFVEEALRWLPDGGAAPRHGHAAAAGAAPAARASWWPTTTPTCATTSRRLLGAALDGRGRRRRRARRSRPSRASAARPRAHRRDDAGARRLRPAARAARRPAHARAAGDPAVGARRRGGARRGPRGRRRRLPGQAVLAARAAGARRRRSSMRARGCGRRGARRTRAAGATCSRRRRSASRLLAAPTHASSSPTRSYRALVGGSRAGRQDRSREALPELAGQGAVRRCSTSVYATGEPYIASAVRRPRSTPRRTAPDRALLRLRATSRLDPDERRRRAAIAVVVASTSPQLAAARRDGAEAAEPRQGRVPGHARPRAAQPAGADPHRAAADALRGATRRARAHGDRAPGRAPGRLVDDLLDVSRITARQGRAAPRAASSSPTSSRGRSRWRARCSSSAGTRCDVDVPAAACVVDGDRRGWPRWSRTCSPTPPSTRDRGRPHRGRAPGAPRALVASRVRDNGIGIDAEHAASVFDLFVAGARRPSTARRAASASAWRSCAAWSSCTAARVEARSAGPRPGQRVHRAPAAARRRVEPRRATRPPAGAPCRCPAARRVLVVDDNDDAAEMLAELLDAAATTSRVAHDGADRARRSAAASSPTSRCSTSACR